MADGLTEAAQKEIRDAIAIVREDRFEKFVRSRQTPPKVEKDEKDELIENEEDKSKAPPKKEKEEDVKEDKPVRKSTYWGEILDE
jgi:hypothetical protein